MTDLSARLKQLKKAMTPGPWTWRGGAPQFYGLEGKDSQDVLCPLDGAVYSEYSSDSATIQIRCDEDAAVIALGDLLPALALALQECAEEASSWIEQYYTAGVRKYPSEQRRYERDNECVVKARVLLAQIAERLTKC